MSGRSGALTIACGIGLVAAMKAVIGPSVVSRVRHFGIAAVYSTIALLIPWTWEWTFQKLSRLASLFAFSHITAQSMEMLSLTILILTMLVPGIALAMWFPIRAMAPAPITADEDKHREPALVLFTSAALCCCCSEPGNTSSRMKPNARLAARDTRHGRERRQPECLGTDWLDRETG